MLLKPDTQHSEYSDALPRWTKCRDVIAGEDAVHNAGEKYLPKLSGQDANEYAAYVKRTPFYNATARTIDGLVGMLFRKEPVVTAPAAMDSMLDDMTLTDCDFNELSEIVARDVIGVGRVGLLVEYPQVFTGPMTMAQAAAQNHRPYVTTYKAESIINWRTERINNAMQIVMLALTETVIAWKNDFESEQKPQVRALLLEEGRYIQRVYQKDDKNEWLQVGSDITPLMNGKPLGYIPLVLFGPSHNDIAVQKAPVYDLVTLNLSHYRTTADLEHGAHFTGLPTAVVTGYAPESGEKLSIGSATAWVFPAADADAKYLEFTGQGLEALEKRLAAKEAGMAAIGARMLAPEKKSAEAEGTVQLRHSGEGAVLASIGDMIEHGFDRVLTIMAEWGGINGEVMTDFNDDFVDTVMTAQDVLALVQAWQAGALSFESLFWNLKQGELVESETTVEQEQTNIKTGLKPTPSTAPAAQPTA
jgi:hypothetical protein